MKTCVSCGASFERSPTDFTVRCPGCRHYGPRPGPAPGRPGPCTVCGGSGRVAYGPTATPPHTTNVVPCHRCGGTGINPNRPTA